MKITLFENPQSGPRVLDVSRGRDSHVFEKSAKQTPSERPLGVFENYNSF